MEEAFDFTKEVRAHRLTKPDDPQSFWDIPRRQDRELEGRTRNRQKMV